MRTFILSLAAVTIGTLAHAGPEKIQFPNDYLKGVLYQTLDRPDSKQYRELYAPPAAVEAVRKGQPIPYGTILTLVQWSVHTDEKGNPLKDASGRFLKKDIIAHTVMQKERGWGGDYPADWPRNGEWEYAVFTADGKPNPKGNANNKACFTCHLPHAKQDFVISLAKLNNTFPSAKQSLVEGRKGDVNIASFAFLPAKITAMAGKALTFFNSDDTPHQITVAGGPRTEVFLRGQKASLTLDKPGEYNYICGLHPSMKGVIEVK
ncbi:MAG TPA: cytochrome P460 family protein [Burkholderiales bacterium]|nr:cytochrome P460 family protein [Burkholderiales bacterium]